MPQYVFRCPECKAECHSDSCDSEIDHDCAVQRGENRWVRMKRVYQLGGISFKGNGFYSTDK